MAKLLVIIAILGLFAFSWLNYDIGDTDMALAYGLSGLGIIIFSYAYSLYLKPAHDKASRDKLLEWVFDNREQLKLGGVRYGLELINMETTLTRYCIVYSFMFFTRKTYTNYVVKDSNKSIIIGIVSTLSNLVVGWWGLPWGPIYTVQSLFINIANKEKITVGNIINSGLHNEALSVLT